MSRAWSGAARFNLLAYRPFTLSLRFLTFRVTLTRLSIVDICECVSFPGGVQPGVARGLTFSVDLRQDRAPSHADTAELRPCHPDRVTPTALRERCRSHKELCLEVLAVGHEVGHKDKHLRRRWR